MAGLDSFLRPSAAKCMEHYVTTPDGDQPLHPIPSCTYLRSVNSNFLSHHNSSGLLTFLSPLFSTCVNKEVQWHREEQGRRRISVTGNIDITEKISEKKALANRTVNKVRHNAFVNCLGSETIHVDAVGIHILQ